MKFIHCSDIHLDSPMESNLTAAQARERNNEICSTFSRMVAYAKNNHVSAVLLCGDLFDTNRVSATTGRFILDTIAETPAIRFLYLKGNHDEANRAFAGRNLPDNLVSFGSQPCMPGGFSLVWFGSMTPWRGTLTAHSLQGGR